MHPVLLWPLMVEGSVFVLDGGTRYGDGEYGTGGGDGESLPDDYLCYGKGNGWSYDGREGYGDHMHPGRGYF